MIKQFLIVFICLSGFIIKGQIAEIEVTDVKILTHDECGSIINKLDPSILAKQTLVKTIVHNGVEFDIYYCAWGVLGQCNFRWCVHNKSNQKACIKYKNIIIDKDGVAATTQSGEGDKCQSLCGDGYENLDAQTCGKNGYTGGLYGAITTGKAKSAKLIIEGIILENEAVSKKLDASMKNYDNLFVEKKYNEALEGYKGLEKEYPENQQLKVKISNVESAIKSENEEKKRKEDEQHKKQEEEVKRKENEKIQQDQLKKQQEQKRLEEERIAKEKKEKFDRDNQYQKDRKEQYDKNQQSAAAAEAGLAALYVGFYLFDTPVNGVYEGSPSNFFSIGPTNGITSIPIITNSLSTIGNYGASANSTSTVGASYFGYRITTFNFGLKSEFGRAWDKGFISVPLRGNFGYLPSPSQLIWNASGGLNLFFGKKVKFGLCYDYNYFNTNKYENDYSSNGTASSATSYTSTDISSYLEFGISTLKLGLRLNSQFDSKKYNESSPFLFDLFLTLNRFNDFTYYGYTPTYSYYSANQRSIGIEFNLTKLNKFGVFGRIIPMMPIGAAKYQINSIPKYAETFLEFGIKREYTWFKKKETYKDLSQINYNDDEPWANRYSINIGLSLPNGNWKNNVNPDGKIADAYQSNSGFGAKTGFVADFTSTLYLKRLKYVGSDKIKSGMNVGLEYTYQPYSWKNAGGVFSKNIYTPFSFFNLKVGTTLSFKLNEKTCFDIFYNSLISYSQAGGIDYSYSNPADNLYSINASGSGSGICNNFGFNFKISKINLGLDYASGYINYDTKIKISDEFDTNILDEYFNSSFKVGFIRIKTGYNF